ncbi:MAG: hypothetical protein FWE56_03495 [Candidatus Bathyarchaeota archaeon]|nr:hypothetical protein [Candidatus Termiticorpusculum sp.]
MVFNQQVHVHNNGVDAGDRKIHWNSGDIMINPVAETVILTVPVSHGRKGHIHGYHLNTSDPEGNTFRISWIHKGIVKNWDVVFASMGTVSSFEKTVALNELQHADPQSLITIAVLDDGYGAYSASLAVAEEVLQ